MIESKEGAIGGNAGVITNVDTRRASFQAHMVVEADTLTQSNRAVNDAISSDLAVISHDNIATRLGEQSSLGRHKAIFTKVHCLQRHQPLLDPLLPGFRPGPVLWLQSPVQPGHVGKALFVLFAVIVVGHKSRSELNV